MDLHSVADEIEHLRNTFPKVKIQSATNEFITASYERTPYTRIKTTLTFPKGYPDHELVVTVTSDKVVPPGLKKKLEKELGDVARDAVGTHEQVDAVFGRLVNFVNTNKFVPCWRELKQCVDLVQKHNSIISINNVKGLIKLRLKADKYYYACTVFINDGYPSTIKPEDYGQPCRLTLKDTNFPIKIQTMLTLQAKELVRRMQDGMTADRALQMSNPIKAPSMETSKEEPPKVRLTQETLKGLKRDTETLKRVGELRGINAATTQGNANVKAHKAKERKDARRAINKITQTEIAEDTAAQAKEEQWQLEEKARLAGYNLEQFDHGTDPQPSLLSLVTFLITKIQKLPEETCPLCHKLSLPANPEKLHAMYASLKEATSEKEKKFLKEARRQRPTRTYCGCWYHYACLDFFMTEPPFGASCPNCERRVYHPDWSADTKELERAWATKQARQREIEDAAMFL